MGMREKKRLISQPLGLTGGRLTGLRKRFLTVCPLSNQIETRPVPLTSRSILHRASECIVQEQRSRRLMLRMMNEVEGKWKQAKKQ